MYLRRLIKTELTAVVRDLYGPETPDVEITLPRDPSHGDYATNFPLKAARQVRKHPMELAAELAARVGQNPKFDKAESAAPGFVNLFLSHDLLTQMIERISAESEFFSHYRVSPAMSINVEFVSANPTGPLTVGHGRNACLGDSIGRILAAVGHRVTREYYFNNAGRQMKILAESLRARYLEAAGQGGEFPEEGYVGEYISEIAREVLKAEGPGLVSRSAAPSAGVSGSAALRPQVPASPTSADAGRAGADLAFFRQEAEKKIFAMIRRSLDKLGVRFDIYFNEDRLYQNGSVAEVLEKLKARNLVYESDGAVWFRGEAWKLPKDPVLVKKTGEPTYRLPDVAYHIDKLSRISRSAAPGADVSDVGRTFDQMIDILGADHIDEHREVLAILQSLDYPTDHIRGIIYQFVTLVRDGKPVKMSTRRAEYVTLDELLDEVGPDVARFFFLCRKADTHLEFDLELAKKESQENPVYYVQYAHARLAGIFRTAAEEGFSAGDIQKSRVDLLHPESVRLGKKILSFGDVLESCLTDLEVTAILWYLRELAESFHHYYTEVRVVDAQDRDGTLRRLKLCGVVQKILKSTLTTLGIRAPDRM